MCILSPMNVTLPFKTCRAFFNWLERFWELFSRALFKLLRCMSLIKKPMPDGFLGFYGNSEQCLPVEKGKDKHIDISINYESKLSSHHPSQSIKGNVLPFQWVSLDTWVLKKKKKEKEESYPCLQRLACNLDLVGYSPEKQILGKWKCIPHSFSIPFH